MGGYWQLGQGEGAPKGGRGAAHDPLQPHAYRVSGGMGGVSVIIALSRLCQEETLEGLKDQRHSNPFN